MKADEKNNKLSKIAGQKSNFVDNPSAFDGITVF